MYDPIRPNIRESMNKEAKGELLEKYSNKTHNLIRTAEKFDTGTWIVKEYNSRTNLSGEYTNKEFQKIKRYFK